MIIKILVFNIPLISAIYILVGIKLFREREKNRVNYFSLLMFATAIYSFGYFLELNCESLDTLLLVRNFEFFGTILIPSFGILFVAELTKFEVTKKIKSILFIISALFWLVFITNPFHSLFYKSINLLVGEYGVTLTEKGTVYYLFMVYIGVFLISSSIMLLKAYQKAKKKNRKNSVLFVLIIFQIPWLAILIIILGYDTYIDPVPATIMIMCVLFVVNEIKNDMFELQINRWKNTFANIGEPAFLVSKGSEIVCSNMNANYLINELKISVKDITEILDNGELDSKPVFFTINDEVRWFNINKNDFDIKNKLKNYLLIDITENRLANEELRISEEKYRLLVTQMQQGLAVHEVILDEVGKPIDYRFLGTNESFWRLTGLKHENVIGKTVLEILPSTESYWIEKYGQVALTGEPIQYENYSQELGKYFEIIAYSPQPKQFAVIISDISERKRLEIALSNEKNLIETTLISVGDGVISTDNKGNVVFLNRVAEFLTGWTQATARGKSIEEVCNSVNEFTREKNENIVEKVLESRKILEFSGYTLLISKDGSERHIEGSAAPIMQENEEIVGIVLVVRDFSEKKQKEIEIFYLSYHDQLTGLFNRRFYEEELKRLDTERNLPMTIVMADVNGLKLINDSFGHVMGDELLIKVAEVMTKGCRTDDIIARLGGDEFVILLPKTGPFETEQIIKRIKGLASKEKVGSIDISISFGYETKNNMEEKIQEIFKKAEDHMYKKKLFEGPSMRGKTINAIINTLHEKNKREEQHSHRVSALCKSMGEILGLPEHEIEELESVGLLHDIGKIAIDENILNKSGELIEDEWKEIKRHPEIGYRILNTVNDMSDMANYVLYHHERWDGKGYPKGLKGDEIPLVSRIISIADAYDAMTSERSYRSAMPKKIAIEDLQQNAGLQFDPVLIRVFVENSKLTSD
ncbi:MAG: histidine kinase N-terminal 7TM domain-containing protein [Desulfosporosinus sp.]|nr:histidine kinase N-terminal 7TM domain-containing protein [Desulfosporosinus sp.]